MGMKTITDNENSNHNSGKETGTSRINKMTEFLKSRRNKTIQKKVPIDHQLLAISQEELAFKKEMMANMKEQEMDFNKTMKDMQATLTNFTNTMAETFGSMMGMLNTPKYIFPTAITSSAYTIVPLVPSWKHVSRRSLQSTSSNTTPQKKDHRQHERDLCRPL